MSPEELSHDEGTSPTVELIPRDDRSPVGRGMTSRRIFGSSEGSWNRPVFMEWELTAATWTDRHPHDEFNFVLDGELHVRTGDTVVVARTGDLVRVPAGAEGHYSAPVHARMLAVYDHNPDGAASTVRGLEQHGAEPD